MPKQGEPTTKTFEGKQCHMNSQYHLDQWVCHSSSECNSNPVSKSKTQGAPEASRCLKTAKLAAAVLGEEGDALDDGFKEEEF
jgi:hypothetical protein